MIDPIQAGIAGLKPATKLLTKRPDPEFRKTFIPTYKGDSKYGSIMDDYYQSEMFDRDAYFNVSPIQPTISLMNPLFGSMGPGQMGQMGDFNDFLKSRYESMLSSMPSKVVRSQEYMDKMDLYGEAYDKMGFGNPSEGFPGTSALNPIPQDPEAIQQLLGPDGKPMQPFTGDASPVGGPAINFNEPITPKGPTASTGQEFVFQKMFEDAGINPFGPQEGVMPELDNIGLITDAPGYNPFGPTDVPLFGEQEQQPGGGQAITNPSDSFGIGSNPIINNPIAPMPTMPTTPNTQPGHSHDDLLSGIGKLFEQYFPQQGSQQINQQSPMFDAAGNSVPDGQTQSSQVFGNMITPNFGGGY